jgi:hypothetical protein
MIPCLKPCPRPAEPRAIRRAAIGLALLLLAGCGKPAPKAEEHAEAAPAPVAEAPKETIADMMKRLGIDPRVRVDDADKAPENPQEAETVLVFFDAMVRGNGAKLSPMLSALDQAVLADMQQSGQWKAATEGINRVNVGWTAGTEPGTLTVLGFFTVGDDFAAQLWSLAPGAEGKPSVMTALPAPPKVAERLQGAKSDARIKQWLALNKQELAAAKLADEIVEIPQQDRSVKGESDEGGSGGESAPSSPGSPSGPGRTKPDGKPVAPPRGPPLKPG